MRTTALRLMYNVQAVSMIPALFLKRSQFALSYHACRHDKHNQDGKSGSTFGIDSADV